MNNKPKPPEERTEEDQFKIDVDIFFTQHADDRIQIFTEMAGSNDWYTYVPIKVLYEAFKNRIVQEVIHELIKRED